jgi:SARP family transcriptional regulator, regulator of embCAB operon
MGDIGLEFGVLGPLLLSVDGTPVALGAPKQRAVLAMLVINRNRPVGVESLINAVWHQSPVPAARASIQTYVSNLRRLLDDAGVDPRTVLASAPPGYRLSVADGDCDLGRFSTDKTAGIRAAATGRFEQASGHLSAALAQWRGPVLDDLRNFAFVEAFATALTEDKVLAQTARAEAEIACGRAYAVIGELETFTAEHPYREPLWAQLITAYYVTERQSDALEAYRRLKTTLAEDLGIDPGPTLRALHARILRQEPLDTKRAAQRSAASTITNLEQRAAVGGQSAVTGAGLRDTAGRHYPLHAVATRIGRLADNDIVLNDADVSRHHAVIIDTGTSFVITDLRSANGVEVQRRRIRTSANLADGDQIRIGDHEFTFEIDPR